MSLGKGSISRLARQVASLFFFFFGSSFFERVRSDALVEAIPDLFTWFLFESSFQDEYFGVHASPIENLLCKHSSVMMDVCWSLFGMMVWVNQI
jgi:hypothetical protein